MKEKSASEILRNKVPTEFSDELFVFSQNLPLGYGDKFHTLIAHLIPAVYYADRIEENEWLAASDIITPNTPMVLLYEIGISMIMGYHDGDNFRDMQHQIMPEPLFFRYINSPL